MDDGLTALIDERLAGLSAAQKVRLLVGRTFWRTQAEPDVGLHELMTSDGPVGVRGEWWDERDTSAVIPSPTALAASWDPGLVQTLGELLGREARRKGVDVLLAPTINLHRSPLGGRHFEAYSEDPVLTGAIGAAYVRGVQSEGVAACGKHYVANDAETDRFTVDNLIDERTLRELYLAPFAELVDAGVWTVMSAYNSVNGHTMTESPLLATPLKDEWGFDGAVVSDWTAVRSTEPAASAAQDLAMPGPNPVWAQPLLDAVEAGRVSETVIDAKLRRLLRLAARVGRLDGVAPAVLRPQPEPAVGERELIRRAAAAGTVLVRNEDRTLPLDRTALRRVAVLGPNAAAARIQGGGSAGVYPAHVVSPLDGLRTALGDEVDVTTAAGAFLHDEPLPVTDAEVSDPVGGEPGFRVRMLDGDLGEIATEVRHQGKLIWLADPVASTAARIDVNADLHADVSGTWTIAVGGVGHYQLDVGAEANVVDDTFGADDGDPVAVLFTPPHASYDVELAAGETIPLAVRHTPAPDAPGTLDYRGVWLAVRRPRRTPADELAEAVRLARQADAAVVVVGTTDEVESEGFDRTTLDLPGRQDELVSAVAAVNPRTVVVVNAGSPVLMPWREQVAVVLLGWFGGQEFGAALADVLLGDAEPGGRLPTTWPARQDDVPVLSTTPVDGTLRYGEGLSIGYRAWAGAEVAPAYPFGFGLGYTTWSLDDLRVVERTVAVRVTNTGERPGRQVVQVYLSRPDSAVQRAPLWLAGFGAVTLGPGRTADVTVELPLRAFQHWDIDAHDWVTEPGRFVVSAGTSATDRPLTTTLAVPETP